MTQATPPSTTRRQPGELPPGPRGLPLVGVLPEILRQGPLDFVTRMARDHGDIVFYRLGRERIYMVNEPELIKHVLNDPGRKYIKGFFFEKQKSTFGEGLLTSDGALWKRQRRLVQPAFHHQRIAQMADVICRTIVEMREDWEPLAQSGQTFDVVEKMMEVTQRIIVRTMFGTDLTVEREVVDAMPIILEYMLKLVISPVDLAWLPTPGRRRYERALRAIDGVIYRLIQQRRQQPTEGHDVLSMLLAARDEDGQGMSDQQLRDELVTIFIAGHETTANSVAWLWYLLSLHPEAERRMHQEIDSVLQGRVPTLQDLPNLRYTQQVADEAMRLYAPIWALGRTLTEPDELGGYQLPAGAHVVVSPFVMHRHPRYWESPETFDPDRFLPERSSTRPRYAYFPFGGGTRMCIANNLAQMEQLLLVTLIAQRFSLELAPGARVEPEALVTLRPRNGVPVRLRRRDPHVASPAVGVLR
jgi:cytochrome P450